jgi:hypothetical protein
VPRNLWRQRGMFGGWQESRAAGKNVWRLAGILAPASCGAFADERRIVAREADACGRETLIQLASGSAAPRVPQSWSSTDSAPRHTGKLIATLRCAAPARRGAFDPRPAARHAFPVGRHAIDERSVVTYYRRRA